MAKMDFTNTNSRKLVNTVMKKADETDLDNKKIDIDVDLFDMNERNEYLFGMEDIDYLGKIIEDDGFGGAIEAYAKKDGRYEISSGHRRFVALKNKGYKKIPTIVSSDVDYITKTKRLIDKNITHRDITPLRWARILKEYEDVVISEEKKVNPKLRVRDALAEHFNMSPSNVHKYKSLLKLIPEFQECADKPHFPYNNFYVISTLSTDEQKSLYNRLVSNLKTNEDGEKEDITSYSGTYIKQLVEEYKGKNKKAESGKKEISPAVKNSDNSNKRKTETPSIIINNDDIYNEMEQFSEINIEKPDEIDACIQRLHVLVSTSVNVIKNKESYLKKLSDIISIIEHCE